MSDALKKAHARMAELREQGLLTRGEVLDPVEKARRNPRSLKLAIRAMCWTCEGAGADPGVRSRVATCTLEDACPLWPHRPWQNAAGRAEGDGATEEDDEEDIDPEAAPPDGSIEELQP